MTGSLQACATATLSPDLIWDTASFAVQMRSLYVIFQSIFFTPVFIYTQSGFRTVLYKSCEYGLCLSIQSYLLTDAAGFR